MILSRLMTNVLLEEYLIKFLIVITPLKKDKMIIDTKVLMMLGLGMLAKVVLLIGLFL